MSRTLPMSPVTRLLLSGLLLAPVTLQAQAAPLTLDATQTGGFYADGSTDNHPAFQNYFVGYGTTPGAARTPERRAFFTFHLPSIAGHVDAATLHLKLVFGGLIFGKGPGVPGPGVPDDALETFQLGAAAVPASVVTSAALSMSDALAVFASFDDHPIAPILGFGSGFPTPPPGGDIEIVLDATGIAYLNAHLGADIVLTGWMPSWSEDTRAAPPGAPTAFFEASELVFGHTDVAVPGIPPGSFPSPSLTLKISEPPINVSAPNALLLLAGGMLALRRRRPHTSVARD